LYISLSGRRSPATGVHVIVRTFKTRLKITIFTDRLKVFMIEEQLKRLLILVLIFGIRGWFRVNTGLFFFPPEDVDTEVNHVDFLPYGVTINTQYYSNVSQWGAPSNSKKKVLGNSPRRASLCTTTLVHIPQI
jgi:hypothetical protein